jgi:membrane-bound ClpP family serine protease
MNAKTGDARSGPEGMTDRDRLRPFLHAALAFAALGLAFWLFGGLESRLDVVALLLFLYGVSEAMRAADAVANQRRYEEQPRRPVINELRGVVGARGVVVRSLSPRGQVRVDGELWQAETDGRVIPKGETVSVVAADSLVLRVAPVRPGGLA